MNMSMPTSLLVRPSAAAWHPYHRRGDAEVEVVAEAAGGDVGAQVAVGRRDHPELDGDAAGRADRPHLTALEHAQELGLQLER